MSLDITVYCKQVSADLVPKMIGRLNDFDMIAEVHAEFRFDEETDTGFLPFRFKLKNPYHHILKDKLLKSGFELYIDNFDLEKEKKDAQPKRSLLDRLRGRQAEEKPFAPPEIEKRLQDCSKAVSFVWNAGDSFEGRFASLCSAILTELTNGVCFYTDDGIWSDSKNLVERTFQEIVEYENALPESEIEFHEFDEW